MFIRLCLSDVWHATGCCKKQLTEGIEIVCEPERRTGEEWGKSHLKNLYKICTRMIGSDMRRCQLQHVYGR